MSPAPVSACSILYSYLTIFLFLFKVVRINPDFSYPVLHCHVVTLRVNVIDTLPAPVGKHKLQEQIFIGFHHQWITIVSTGHFNAAIDCAISIEICLDPGGSEHTLTCFKLGIFPFDSSGNVRAARDADAQQGPVEETSPGTQLFSERLPDGYRIRAAIPLADARIKLKRLYPTLEI